ncbi:PKD domain-containing protein, partial [bacterium]|nr:PKD domain-containing protein [bacterium]
TLTVQGVGECAGVFVHDDILLKIDPTPISNAGPDDEICGQRPYQLNPTAQFQSSITWLTSGTGLFSNPNILNPTYTPSAADVGTTVILTLGLSGCKALTDGDFMWLTVHPDPSATISGTSGMCEGTSTPVSIDFTGTPPWSVTYSDGTTPVTVTNINTSPYTFIVSPSITTTWFITAANDAFCNVPSDSIHGVAAISVNPLPDVFVVTGYNGGYYCEGDTGVQIGLNNSQIGMNYTLLRNGLSTGTTLAGTGSALVFGLFTTPGQYAIQGENPVGSCFAMMNDTINVIMNPTPVTDFSTNNACYGDTTFFTLSGGFLPRISSWHWDYGDGTFEDFSAPFNPTHAYPTYGIYPVVLSLVD